MNPLNPGRTPGSFGQRPQRTLPLDHDCLPSSWSGYALSWQHWRFGGISLRLAQVANLEDYVDTAALVGDPNAPEPPYWAYLWPGSRALARYLVDQPEVAQGRCLEVGCGLGLVSVLCASLGGQAFAFDRDANAVGLCRLNARYNDVAVHTWRGDLERIALAQQFDLICAAEVTYDPRLQHALLRFAKQALAPGGTLLCADSVRTFDRAWLVDAAEEGFAVQEQYAVESEDRRPLSVRLVALALA